MTIKKQFSILATIIITIPILCLFYIFIHNYIRSTDRILIKDFIELKKNESDLYSKDELNLIRDTIISLPSGIEAAIISRQNQVILSSIPELPAKTEVDYRKLWHYTNQLSKKYYFQLYLIETDDSSFIILSRVSIDTNNIKNKSNLLPSLIIFLFIIVLFCFILILLIFKTISKSIITLEQNTQEIANGDLSVQINTSNLIYSNEITSISKSLEKMRKSLLDAHNQQNKFIMGMSHDLRTPVAVIKGYTEALSDGIITESEELKNTYSLIASKTTQLEVMIDSLINFMKMNYNDFIQQLSPESITDLIRDFANDAKASGNVFNKKVITNIELEEDYKIPMNKTLISRAFENLLSNALRYTRENDTITIGARKVDNSIHFYIKDTGIGIDKKDLQQIFELFYRGTNSRREEGMGIGLSVVKGVIESHNWEIKVDSEKDVGTCFTIIIPLNKEKLDFQFLQKFIQKQKSSGV